MSQSRDPKSDSDEGLEFTAHSSGQVLMVAVNRPTERKRDLMTARCSVMQTKRSGRPSGNVGCRLYTFVLIVFPTVASSVSETAEHKFNFTTDSVIFFTTKKMNCSLILNPKPNANSPVCDRKGGKETQGILAVFLQTSVRCVKLMDCCLCLCVASFTFTPSSYDISDCHMMELCISLRKTALYKKDFPKCLKN